MRFADAACKGMDTNLFFPERGEDTGAAKAICGPCPVREACLDYALASEVRWGVWGGTSERQRRVIRRNLRAVSA